MQKVAQCWLLAVKWEVGVRKQQLAVQPASQLLIQIHMYACVYVYTHTQEKLHSELPKLILTFYGCCLMEILQKMALECQDLNVRHVTLMYPVQSCESDSLCSVLLDNCVISSSEVVH